MRVYEIFEDHETSQQDMILSRYEAGQISRDEAWKEIKRVTPKDLLFFWEMELNSATDLMYGVPSEEGNPNGRLH